MRPAVIRQRYTPFGGAERFLDNALQALIESGVAVTLYTREWRAPQPQQRLRESVSASNLALHRRSMVRRSPRPVC